MAKYLITNTITGIEFGIYESVSEAGALDVMAKEAGYSDYHEACEAAPILEGEIGIVEVADDNDEPAAEYMVTYYAPSFLKPGVFADRTYGLHDDWQSMPWGQHLPCNASVMLIWPA